MGVLKVTSEQLIDLSGQLTRTSGEVQGKLDEMKNKIEPLVTDWEGAASSEFHRMWDEWQSSAKNLREALDGISTLLGKAGETYRDAEENIKKSMTQ